MHEVQKSDAPRVRVGLGAKLNIGNYENITLDFAVEDSPRAGETVDQAFERVYAKVEEKLLTKAAEVKEEVTT